MAKNTLIQHIDEMHARLTQTAHTERSLVEALGDSLNRFDYEMLQNIRNIATGHEARRGAILNELQALAGSIGMFQPPHEAVGIPQQIMPQQIDYGHQYAPAAGDWRQATKNIQDELEFHLNGHLNGKSSQH